MNFFEQFGVQPILLLAQAVNFLILLFLLNKFLYRPLLKILDERQQKIAKSLTDADKITEELAKIESERDQKLATAMLEAKELINDAKNQSLELIAVAKDQAQIEVDAMLSQARVDIQNEHQKMQQEIRSDISKLIFTTLDKIITTDIPTATKTKITQKIAKEFNN